MQQSVASLFNLYLERSDFREATVEFKQRTLNRFVGWFGDLPVASINVTHAEDYRAMLSKTLKPKSVCGYIENFKPFWSWLQKRGYVTHNPFADLRVTVDEVPRTTFTTAELGRLMGVANDIERLQIAFGLLGCRRGEVLNIQVRDMRLDGIPHAVIARKETSKGTWPWGVKNHRSRYIGLPETIAFDGFEYGFLAAIRTRIVALGRQPEGYLCVPDQYVAKLLKWQEAGELTYAQRRDPMGNHPRMFKALQRRAGIQEPRRFHELRAAFTTSQLDAGMDIGRVAKLVGHASVNQTKHYDRKSQLSLVAEAARVASKSYVTDRSPKP